VNNSAPNPFQPMVDAFASGMSKLVAAILLGAMVYLVVMFAFRLALRGRSSTKLYREFSDLVARAAFGFSMLFFLYVGFVVMEPAKMGGSQSAASDVMAAWFLVSSAKSTPAGAKPSRPLDRPIPSLASCYSAAALMAANVAWCKRRWGHSTVGRTDEFFSIPHTFASSDPGFMVVLVVPAKPWWLISSLVR
jgi:hypothetical protein